MSHSAQPGVLSGMLVEATLLPKDGRLFHVALISSQSAVSSYKSVGKNPLGEVTA